MLGENKNLKDTSKDSLKDTTLPLPNLPLINPPEKREEQRGGLYYVKTNKLITALYMVTDTMEKEEPLRLKLRTLGVDILSDITMPKGILDTQKINQILSFLSIAFDVRMISEMNCNILRKEFTELKESIQEFTTQNHLWLEKFIQEEKLDPHLTSPLLRGRNKEGVLSFSKGHTTRIGVQKGSTLMDALNKVGHAENFQILKDKRRESIIKVIKTCPSSGADKSDGISIKDIALAIHNLGEEIGEKTLQRELISMVKDNVLKKTGEKRWSQYFLN
ncbi:MAG: hypothetical protein NT161_01900 [Candidatus Nomurabacteria bacterium]|nr:hypothetical protein [Candidatus Nomurabacteria bacterium]